MVWLQILVQALPSLTALLFVLGSLWWGRQVLNAKDAEIRAKQSEMAAVERITPSRMLEEMEGLKRIYEELANQARNHAAEKVAQLTKATGEERERLQSDLSASRFQVADLENRVTRSEDTADAFRRMIQDLDIRAQWQRILEQLPPKTRAYFREAKLDISDGRFILIFPYGYHHKMASESLHNVEPLIKGWLGESVTVQLRLQKDDPPPF